MGRDSLTRVMIRLNTPEGDQTATNVLLLVAALSTWTLFATDGLKGIDPWYTMLITATTIGYGDLGPLSDDHKWMSAFILPLLTNAFAGWSTGDEQKPAVPKFSQGNCGVDLDAWKDALFNPTADKTSLENDRSYFAEQFNEVDEKKADPKEWAEDPET